MNNDAEEMNREFDRITSILKEVDSGKFPLMLIMSTNNGNLEFAVGGNLEPSERISFVKILIESYEANGYTTDETKAGNGMN